jgi:stage II sporulation protein D
MKIWSESLPTSGRSLGGVSRSLIAAVAATLAASTTTTVPPVEIAGERFVVIAPEGAVLRIGDDLFRGPLIIRANAAGVTVVESMPPEEYLMGIREVPFAWPDEALKTQAVAARTYLAFVLGGGRSSSGREHGYDICATTACQVYAGVAGLGSADGRRWQQAIAATAGEILVHNGRPAQALYSSTSGTRTRDSEDIFPGLDVPYLSAVDSPGEDSPFVDWSFIVTAPEMVALLGHAGLLHGPLVSVKVETTDDGGGPWQVAVASGTQVERVATYRFRSLINRAAAELMPDRFPANRPDGRRYPQTILSGTFTIQSIPEVIVHRGYRELTRRFQFEGHGWGHQVGMSQFGALAMAEAGASYDRILAHYYGGLTPQPAAGWLPDSITVGLVVAIAEAVILAEGGAIVMVDGVPAAEAGIGIWRFRSEGSDLVARVPIGIGQPPEIRSSRITADIRGRIVRFDVTAPGFLEIMVTQRGREVGRRSFGLIEAGHFEYRLADLIDFSQDLNTVMRVTVSVSAPLGESRSRLILLPERWTEGAFARGTPGGRR